LAASVRNAERTSDPAARLQRAWGSRGGLALALLPVAWAYAGLVRLRRALFALGLRRAHAIDVPVVVIGNLIAGGAGKTPTVMAVVRLLQARGWRPGIVSRGHGRADAGDVLDVTPETPAAECGDEPLLLRLRAGVPVSVGRDRVAAARALRGRHPQIDIVVADDGLQHLRLARDAQVIVFDERGAGNGWQLPAGPLREPLPAAVPPRSVVLYNAAAPSTPLPGWTARRRLAGALALTDWWQGRPASPATLAALAGRPLFAAAGIAQPERFFAMLRAEGLEIVSLPLPDHHDYATLPWPADTADVIVTEKDAVKLLPGRTGTTRVWVTALDFAPDAGFDAALAALLPARPPPPMPSE
jgi:tetraacyldisaccharide 4'-kinase